VTVHKHRPLPSRIRRREPRNPGLATVPDHPGPTVVRQPAGRHSHGRNSMMSFGKHPFEAAAAERMGSSP
jgi:hypothetical protein